MGAMSLASYAMDVRHTRGRRYAEPAHAYRDAYSRDRDRVIHSRAFRRLEAKTQVFTTRFSDHFRNRLTHTLEVAQIARTVAERAGLNTDLAEALALVHDIGPSPFWSCRRAAARHAMREYGDRFDHNLHALRIVEHFEQRYLAISRIESYVRSPRRNREAFARLLSGIEAPGIWPNICWISVRRSKRN